MRLAKDYFTITYPFMYPVTFIPAPHGVAQLYRYTPGVDKVILKVRIVSGGIGTLTPS